MNRKSTLTLSAAVLVVLSIGACARHRGWPSAFEESSPTPASTPGVTSWVTVHEDVWIPAIDALGGHLYAAEQAFDSGSTGETAAQLYGAAARLEEEGDEAVGEWQRNLYDAAEKLESAAADLERGVQVSGEQLDAILDNAWETDVRYSWVTRDAAAWEPIVYEPERYLALALARFEDGDVNATSELLRKAAAILRMETERGTTVADAEELVAARMELREIASEIELAEARDKTRLERVIARVAHSLARHNQLLAEHQYQIGDPTAAANSLDAAATYLERAYEWSGTALEPGTEAVLADAHAAATEAEDVLEPVPTALDLGSKIVAVGTEIDRIAKTLDPAWSVEHTG